MNAIESLEMLFEQSSKCGDSLAAYYEVKKALYSNIQNENVVISDQPLKLDGLTSHGGWRYLKRHIQMDKRS